MCGGTRRWSLHALWKPIAVRRCLGRPLVCYKYHTPLIQLVCNWAAASRCLGSAVAECVCGRPHFEAFCHADTGHVITKDVSIFHAEELRHLFRSGPNFRMRPVDTWAPSKTFEANRQTWPGGPGAVRTAPFRR